MNSIKIGTNFVYNLFDYNDQKQNKKGHTIW